MEIPKDLFESMQNIETKGIVGNFVPNQVIESKPIDINDVGYLNSQKEEDIFKAFIPWFLYKPPYGFPRENNVLTLRQFAKNVYIFSVIKTLQDMVSSVPYDIKLRQEYIDEGFNEKQEDKRQIIGFFDNPNGNDESWEYLLRCWVKDVCEIGNFVGVKVFNKAGNFSQVFARDAGTFLKNPDIYGYMGDRADFVAPITQYALTEGVPQNEETYNVDKYKNENYEHLYKENAAYFQYGWTAGARPVPFGKREIMWGGLTPRTNSIYEESPIEILYNQILTLVYGSEYNLDFYLNNNMPTGLLTFKGASQEQANAYKTQMQNQFMDTDEFGNYKKKHFKIPITGFETTFTQMQMSSKDMEVIEQQKWFTRLVWGVFGVTSDDMGIIEDSNKAISENQSNVTKKKAIKPFLRMFEYVINTQLMPEFGHPEYEFKFIDYDLDEDIKKHSLWQQEISMGVRTPRDIATQELGISEEDFDSNTERYNEQYEEEYQEEDQEEVEQKAITPTEAEKYTVSLLKELEQKIIKETESNSPLLEIKGFFDFKSITKRQLDKYKQYFNRDGYKQELTNLAYKEFEKGVEVIEKKLNRNIVVSTQELDNLTDFMINNIQDMNDELVNNLRKQITLGLTNKDSMTNIKQRIKKAFDLSEERARTIIRTETNRIYGAGSFKAAEESGVDFYKYVDAKLDARTSKICKDLQAKYGTPEQAIPLNEKFKLIDGRSELFNPFHCNCRSVTLYVPKDEIKNVDER